MLEILIPQLRFGYSMMNGRPFDADSLDRIIDAMIETRREFGSIGPDGAEMLGGPTLDKDTQRQMQLRRFRAQARRGADETEYYQRLFAGLGLDPAKLSFEEIARLPTTPKAAVRAQPGAFVRSCALTAFRTTTTGTTGRPTSTFFTHNEIRTIAALNAMTFLLRGQITPEDVVQICTSSRATLGNTCFSRGCERVGAVWFQSGLVEPEHALMLLTEELHIPGKKRRVSFLNAYPSYLRELVEQGLREGLGPNDFGLEHISVGGEVVTQGLKTRASRLFGEVEYTEGFGMTETWPFGGTRCEQGHLHWEAPQGLLEILSLESGEPVGAGEMGTMVATPFAPFREAGVVLRYDTEDLVRSVEEPLTCSMRHVPASSDVLGKLRLAAQHEGGWTTPRDVMEALESVDSVPLPARFGFWAEDDGVAVEVVVTGDPAVARRQVGDSLAKHGVPVRRLGIWWDRRQLDHPYPLRGDLREAMFGKS